MSEASGAFNTMNLCPSCFAPKGGGAGCPVCGFEAGAADQNWNSLKPGTLIHGRYVIGRVLGQGGFGITYLGFDLRLNVKLAIKEYYPSGLAVRNTASRAVVNATVDVREDFQRGMEKFLEEARTLARFEDHPNIVSVRDFFEENGTAYMVMTYFEGRTLLKYLEENGGSLSFDEVLAILIPVMNALDEVHASGLIHRDISPDNIFITYSGQVKLLDFGAAKSAMALVNQQSHSIVLKKGYSPAEQYQSRGSLGPWTDIYSMAATIYRSITGIIPPDSLDRLDKEILIPPSRQGVTIPSYAEAALMRALSISPRQRPQSMREFQGELLGETASSASFSEAPDAPASPRTAKQGAPAPTVKLKCETAIPAGKHGPSHRPAEPSALPAKRPFPVALMAVVAVVVIAAIAGFFLIGGKKDNLQETVAVSQPTKTETSASPAGEIELLRQKAEKGDPVSQYRLGNRYQQGKGVPQDSQAAAEWYRKAAEQGYSPAQNDLGNLYIQGIGVPQDYKEGAKWLAKAADQGNPFAQTNLGWMYDVGQGVPVNKAKAVKLYMAAAEQGNPNAQTNLAYMYEKGAGGLEKNVEKAAELYLKAAEKGVVNAQYSVALYYENGIGLPRDRTKAIQWLRKAADQGDIDAANKLKSMGVSSSSNSTVEND